jgi:polyisoprenoid-binding protein YceI
MDSKGKRGSMMKGVILVTSALFFAICAAHSMNARVLEAGAVGDPTKTGEKAMAAPALPAPGTYKIDPVHSFAFFGARHHVVGLVRGRFEKVTGTITASKDPAACSVDVSIDISSISTQNSDRDKDIQGPAYFDAQKFPAMMYQGRGIRKTSASSWVMDGSLTMHGVTKVVPLTFTFKGVFPDAKPGEPARAAFHGTAGVKRAEFGMGARDNLDELGLSTAPDVEIEIDVEADAIPPTQ